MMRKGDKGLPGMCQEVCAARQNVAERLVLIEGYSLSGEILDGEG